MRSRSNYIIRGACRPDTASCPGASAAIDGESHVPRKQAANPQQLPTVVLRWRRLCDDGGGCCLCPCVWSCAITPRVIFRLFLGCLSFQLLLCCSLFGHRRKNNHFDFRFRFSIQIFFPFGSGLAAVTFEIARHHVTVISHLLTGSSTIQTYE